jgi:hypothetical protein
MLYKQHFFMDRINRLCALARIKTILESVDIPEDDVEMRQICDLVSNYLDTKCEHHIVTDYIDIGPDNGYTIRFCDVCMRTFS